MATICREHKLLFIMVPGTGCSSIGKVLTDKFGGEFIPKKSLYENNQKTLPYKHNTIRQLVKCGYLSRVELSIYLKFATVRNPFDLLTTEYQRLIGGWAERLIKVEESKLKQNISEDQRIYTEKLTKYKRKEIKRIKTMSFEEWLEEYFQSGVYKKKSGWDGLKYQIKNKVKSFVISNYYPNTYPLIGGVDNVIRYEFLEEDFNMILKKSGIIRPNEWVAVPKTNPTKGKDNYRDYYTPTARKLVEKNLEQELKVFGYSF